MAKTMKKQPEPVTRENIVSILSSEEAANVGSETTQVQVRTGDEFIDLAEIDKGVQRAAEPQRLRNVLLRSALAPNTWQKIITNLAARRLMALPPPPPPPRH